MDKQANFEELKAEFLLMMDSGDQWGSVMAAWFSVADFIVWEYGESCPSSWEFSPGIACDSESYEFQTLKEMKPSLGALIEFGDWLERASDLLKRKGMDY